MKILEKYISLLDRNLQNTVPIKDPQHLYEPINYMISIGGKRIRPALTLMAADFISGNYMQALPAAMAVELFHNFSLIDDDIMDDAPLRRGHTTVHEKWNINTGILSGDAMLILAYRLFEQYESPKFRDLAILFSETALQVCEGQQRDMDFEKRDQVSFEEYIKMIEQKTAVLVGAALQMGAIVADAAKHEQKIMYEFGRNLGIAFQLQDDYLDAFGDPETFGKQVGGDIIANKKTILFIMTEKMGNVSQAKELLYLYNTIPEDPSHKIEGVKKLFEESGAVAATKELIENYSSRAYAFLEEMNLSADKKSQFRKFGEDLMRRQI